jgi:hypothetical protein
MEDANVTRKKVLPVSNKDFRIQGVLFTPTSLTSLLLLTQLKSIFFCALLQLQIMYKLSSNPLEGQNTAGLLEYRIRGQ